MSLSQFAKKIGVTYLTVLKWVQKGELKTIKLPSGRHRIPDSELKKFLEIEDDQNDN